MTFTPVEYIALIFIVFATIKILVLLINPKSWMNFAKKLWVNPRITTIVCLILAAIVLWYLLAEMTIVSILAVAGFIALLMGIGLAGYVPDLIKAYERQIKSKALWKDGTWFYTLIWVVLMVWGLYVLLV